MASFLLSAPYHRIKSWRPLIHIGQRTWIAYYLYAIMVCYQIYIWPILVPVYPLPILHASSDHATNGIEEVKIIGVQISKGNQITQIDQFGKCTVVIVIIRLQAWHNDKQFPKYDAPTNLLKKLV